MGRIAFADPGVWDRLERGEINPSEGVVKNVESKDMDILVTIETTNEFGKPVEQTRKLCPEPTSVKWPDFAQVAMLHSKRDALEEKKKSKATVHFGQSGSFNPCFTFVK